MGRGEPSQAAPQMHGDVVGIVTLLGFNTGRSMVRTQYRGRSRARIGLGVGVLKDNARPCERRPDEHPMVHLVPMGNSGVAFPGAAID